MRVSFLLLLLLSASVGAEEYYNNWIYPGETFEVDGSLYAVDKGKSPFSIILQKDGNVYVLSYKECVVSQDGRERYCFQESDYVTCEKKSYLCPEENPDCCPYDVSHVQFDAGGANWASRLTFEDITPQLTVIREPEKTTLDLGEQTKVKVTVENTGEDAITGAIYREALSQGFTASTGDFTIKGGMLERKLNLDPGRKLILVYTLRANEYVYGTFNASLTYTYKGAERNITSSSYSIDVPAPYRISHSLSSSSVSIQSPATYTYTIENIDGSRDLDVALAFSGFSSLATSKPSKLTSDGDDFTWQGRLRDGEDETFKIELKSGLTGEYSLLTNAAMQLGSNGFASAVEDVLTVTLTKMTPEIRSTPSTLKPGAPFTLWLYLDNTNGEVAFSSIEGSVTGPGVDRRVTFGTIVQGDRPLVAKLELIAPAENPTYTLSGAYRTPSKEMVDFTISKTFTVDESAGSHVVTQTLNQTDVVPGGTIGVKVRVRNYFPEYRSVRVTDLLPAGVTLAAGIIEKEMSLNADEEREAYSYRILVPGSFTGSTFTVVTEVYDAISGDIYRQETPVTVLQPEPVASPDVVPDDTPVEEEPAADSEQEQSFVRKVVNGIIGFFQGLFD